MHNVLRVKGHISGFQFHSFFFCHDKTYTFKIIIIFLLVLSVIEYDLLYHFLNH